MRSMVTFPIRNDISLQQSCSVSLWSGASGRSEGVVYQYQTEVNIMTEEKPKWYLDMIAELDAEISNKLVQLATDKAIELIKGKL